MNLETSCRDSALLLNPLSIAVSLSFRSSNNPDNPQEKLNLGLQNPELDC